MTKKISVIIPVYNTQKDLSRCLDSILVQTHKNLEVILVNDGSSDNSGKICDRYAEDNANVSVIHVDNGGQGRARNLGLDVASGDYIMFCDSDDSYDDDMAEHLFNAITAHSECNIAMCGLKITFSASHIDNRLVYKTPFISDADSILEMYFSVDKILSSPVNKIYKKFVFDSLRYPEGMIYEDRFISLEMFIKNPLIYFTGEPKYNYYIREGSTIQSAFSAKKLDFLKVCDNDIALIGNYAPQYLSQAQKSYCDTIVMLLRTIIVEDYKRHKETYNNLVILLKEKCVEYKELLPKKALRYYKRFYQIKHGTMFYYLLRNKVGRLLKRLKAK